MGFERGLKRWGLGLVELQYIAQGCKGKNEGKGEGLYTVQFSKSDVLKKTGAYACTGRNATSELCLSMLSMGIRWGGGGGGSGVRMR
jgi:hypothetical protein